MLSLTENTQRYKSLAGFAIFPCGSDIRLHLAICPAGREGIYIISHWSEATIYRTSKASISRLLANISPNRKKERERFDYENRFVLSFCRYTGLGLAHLHLAIFFKFSAKNITISRFRYFLVLLSFVRAALS